MKVLELRMRDGRGASLFVGEADAKKVIGSIGVALAVARVRIATGAIFGEGDAARALEAGETAQAHVDARAIAYVVEHEIA
jgi:hypothetical protein